MSEPLPLAEAQARLLAMAQPLGAQDVPVGQALGRYLAQPLLALRTQPAAPLSAMDGYAVHGSDVHGPWRVVGESAAGRPYVGAALQTGEATRISTGALMPPGAQAVVLQEDVAREGERLHLTGTPPQPPTRHVRQAGLDFASGNVLVPAGTQLSPAHIALAIAGGHGVLAVSQRPAITVLDSGDELVAPGQPCAPHQLPASNSAMLCAMVAQLGCAARPQGPVPDTLDAMVAALDAAHDANVIVTSGGASVGDHDFIRPALAAWGADLAFWKIAVRPGKPLLVARKGRQIVLGLPGNPVSSYVGAQLFLLPLLRSLMGASACLPPRATLPLAAGLPANTSDRKEFIRGFWDGHSVTPHPARDSSALASLAASNCLIERPSRAGAAGKGDMASVLLLQ
jgi:molybdopterin molybdotransferase